MVGSVVKPLALLPYRYLYSLYLLTDVNRTSMVYAIFWISYFFLLDFSMYINLKEFNFSMKTWYRNVIFIYLFQINLPCLLTDVNRTNIYNIFETNIVLSLLDQYIFILHASQRSEFFNKNLVSILFLCL